MKMAGTKRKITIDEIEGVPIPPSPRRQKKNMTCGVVSKSPLKSTKNDGKMFSLSLCDEKQANTIRAVCFDGGLYDKFEATKTYELEDFVVKKSFTSSSSVEIQLDKNTKVSEAEKQMALEHQNYTVCEILRGNVGGVGPINLKAKVTSIEDVCAVGAPPDTKSKREVIIGDSTGSMTLVLWRERAENVEFNTGDVLQMNNMGLNSFNNHISLTTTFETSIIKIEEEMMVKAVPKPVKKAVHVVSMKSNVVAIKDFTCTYKCVGCHQESKIDAASGECEIVECRVCSATLLTSSAMLNNHCLLLLSDNKWYGANTKIIQHLFGWDAPKLKITESEKLCILKSNYLFRVDASRKIVEHVGKQDDDEEEKNDEVLPIKTKID